ncbi:hypothetical protein HPP92_018479 [Vanilla planifolia]|uniref:pyruvate decarboxylase n=1 Tax=Vanilla planifolia TaxID=51239 RepID=A0A835URL3_VANPL|nr:hypothetical protein HPP92_019097 [Vanilla planifolia]KAG0469151.1 hypothetical protein HPP92_018479 [Vanilla planifolia]
MDRSVGQSIATLGYAQASKDKRIIACIGDRSFQATMQDVSSMIRCKLNCIIFLINNGGNNTVGEIHDGPTMLSKRNYTALVAAIHNGKANAGRQRYNARRNRRKQSRR